MFARPRKLHMEQMERREMMAGDMTVFMQNGNLFINEATGQAGLDNAVSVGRLNDTTVRVTGLPTLADGTVSKINGNPFQDFTINANTSLFVNLAAATMPSHSRPSVAKSNSTKFTLTSLRRHSWPRPAAPASSRSP